MAQANNLLNAGQHAEAIPLLEELDTGLKQGGRMKIDATNVLVKAYLANNDVSAARRSAERLVDLYVLVWRLVARG